MQDFKSGLLYMETMCVQTLKFHENASEMVTDEVICKNVEFGLDDL